MAANSLLGSSENLKARVFIDRTNAWPGVYQSYPQECNPNECENRPESGYSPEGHTPNLNCGQEK